MSHKVEFEIGGRTMIIESGKIAKQANGACTVQYGDSMVISTVCSGPDPKLGFDFFPLTVEYREKSYAAGKIPGGFFKREARPSEKEIISARIIDRPIRPLFPNDFQSETQCINYIVSHDKENDTDILALIGTGASLAISDVPFEKTVAGARVGRIDGEFIINPTFAQQEECDLCITMAGTADSIAMVEGSGTEVSEADVIDALAFGHDNIKQIIAKIEELRGMCGKEKFEYTPVSIDDAIKTAVAEIVGDKLKEVNIIADKEGRRNAKKALQNEILEALAGEYPDDARSIKNVFHDLDNKSMRSMILKDNQRIDGRKLDEVREITPETSFLPRAHGSALFTRGQTQALVAVTLGTKMDEQRLDELDGESTKSYMLHYNFPPFCVGEARPIRGTSRREVGHGVLAERALQPVIPSDVDFPYTLRLVSEVLESNGSSSMASVCAGSLAMMDAGVPIKTAVAGIAMGLIQEGDEVRILTDILGDEDHFGDMDFKVAGTNEGITAIQMDIKIDGLDIEVMRKALEQAKVARLHILDKMNAVISTHRESLSQHAPRIISFYINPTKIGEVIGPGGKMNRSIVEETGAKVDIEDDGKVLVASVDAQAGQAAVAIIQGIVEDPEPGKTYLGRVTRIIEFGAIVEILPKTDGLVHISELDMGRVGQVEDICKLGDEMKVKVLGIDGDRVRLSRRAVLIDEGAPVPEGEEDRYSPENLRSGGRGGGRGGGRDRGPRRDRR